MVSDGAWVDAEVSSHLDDGWQGTGPFWLYGFHRGNYYLVIGLVWQTLVSLLKLVAASGNA